MAQEYTAGSAIPAGFPALEPVGRPVKAIALTQAEYDDLQVVDPDILYVITE